MNARKMLQAVAASLGFGKEKKPETNDELQAIADAFEKEHGMSYEEAVQKEKDDAANKLLSDETITSMRDALGDDAEDSEGKKKVVIVGAAGTGANAAVQALAAKVKAQGEKIAILEAETESTDPVERVSMSDVAQDVARKALMGAHTETHVFGIENDIFSRDRKWNEVSATRKPSPNHYTSEEKTQFGEDIMAYSTGLSARFAELQQTGQLAVLAASGDIDYTGIEEEHGKRYMVRRFDAIITYLRKLESVTKYFPLRYGVQDEETMTDSFIGKSFTQAYQEGEVFAGSHGFSPMKSKVHDVMLKTLFKSLKKLEKQFIGYLNKESSDPMKWNFIEWLIVRISIKQHNEVEIRRISGVRVEPTEGKSQFYKYASNGIMLTLENSVEDLRVRRFEDVTEFDSSTLVDYVHAFVEEVYMATDGDLSGMALYFNKLYIPAYLEGYREKYGAQNDFNGEQVAIKDFSVDKIIGIPNMGKSKLMWMAPEDAIEIQEDKAGEGFMYYFERHLEQLYVASYKKEGTFAFGGRKYASKAAIEAAGLETNIFVNNPVTLLAADATILDATKNFMFQSIANTGATAVTDITGAVHGELYSLACGSLTNKTTVAKADKFSEITATFTPTAVGDYLKVIYNPTTSKFLEYSRKVGGTVTKNADLLSPEYVESI